MSARGYWGWLAVDDGVVGPALAIRGLVRRFGATTAVDGVSLEVAAGEFLTILGPSGCGKTTLLGLIAGFARPDAGEIRLGGQPVGHAPSFRRNIGVVFQDLALFPHLSVARTVAFGLEMRRLPRPEVARRTEEALALVRLEELGGRRPHQLSGGQRQRVALARALVIRPTLLLLDEPLSALDLKLREEMRLEISLLQRRLGIATLFVTHDQTEALLMSDRIAVMNQGRIEQLGTPAEIYERPATRFVAGFVGAMNFVPSPVDASTQLAVRPERARMVAAPPGPGVLAVPGQLVRSFYLGNVTQHWIDTVAGRLTVEAHAGAPVAPAPGTAVWFVAERDDCRPVPAGTPEVCVSRTVI